MKKTLLPSLICLLVILVFAVVPTEAEGKIYDDTLRLHILALSDSDKDQEIKLIIRDRVLEKYAGELKGADNIEDALKSTSLLLEDIKSDVDLWLSEFYDDVSSEVYLTEEWYDTREYENFTLPKGYYRSLKIVIGDGNGKNWWCVMYPPLCLDIATEDAERDDGIVDYTKEEISLISGRRYNVKFKLLEFISDIFP